MKLSECKQGVLLISIRGYKVGKIAMVVGISQNSTGEAIPLVQWQDNLNPEPVHHVNFEIYEG